MPTYKTDVSFLEKISIGAIGTRRVFEDLQKSGHSPIELERGSRSFKIWRDIKIKRIRVPDILCTKCGKRIESRGKTSFEISMSHSYADADRAWNNGLYDRDYVGLVGVSRDGERPIDWVADERVSYVPVGEMRKAFEEKKVKFTLPKGAQEGFETRAIWPAVIASAPGVVSAVTESRIQFKRFTDQRTISYPLKNGVCPLVSIGDNVNKNQILASVVSAVQHFDCDETVGFEYFLKRLASSSVSERYAATKALRFFGESEVLKNLRERVDDLEEHIYVRMEAASSLARADIPQGWDFIEKCINDEYDTHRLEAVIILAEIKHERSARILNNVLADKNQHAEIRAGAAWSIGELRNPSFMDALVHSFGEVEEVVKIEAARALSKFAPEQSDKLIALLSASDYLSRPGIAWALSKSGNFSVSELLAAGSDEDVRAWVAYILGMRDENLVVNEIEDLKGRDPQVYFAATVLWKIVSSWVYDLEEYG